MFSKCHTLTKKYLIDKIWYKFCDMADIWPTKLQENGQIFYRKQPHIIYICALSKILGGGG